jgi:hypothetical protein
MTIVRKGLNLKPKTEPSYVTQKCEICLGDYAARVGGRGRPQKYCPECKRSRYKLDNHRSNNTQTTISQTSLTPEERIDYLEYLLRSRGTHISQHRH